MAAVIRVKRRVTEDPLEAFVLNSKRRRQEEVTADKDEVSTILKFAGTVQNQTEGLGQATKQLTKDEARTIVNRVRKEPIDQMRQKKRDEQRQNAHNERFRIVNCSRTTAAAGGEEGQSNADAAVAAKEITILDIEKESGEQRLAAIGGPEEEEVELKQQQDVPSSVAGHQEGDYVYDLYVPDVNQPELEWSEQFLENMLRVQPYDLMYDCYRDPNGMFPDSDCESDDSNQENHYGNEYPDSDESVGERAMRRAMETMQLQGEGDSSEDEDFYEGPKATAPEGYVHTLEVDEMGFRGDVDFQDTADRYGVAYARYKKKILKAFENAQEVPTDDEEEDERSSGSDYFGAKGATDDEEECYSESELDKYA